MRRSPLFRIAARLLCIALVASSVPLDAIAQGARRQPESAPTALDFYAEGLFDNSRPDRHGNLTARQREPGARFLHYYAPQGGDFRRQLRIGVRDTDDRLQLTLLADDPDRLAPRLRLVSPSGEVIAPGRRADGRYARMRNLSRILEEQLDPTGPRAQRGQEAPLSLALSSQPVGTYFVDPVSGQALVDLQEPEPGTWTIRVIGEDAARSFLTVAVMDRDADLTPLERQLRSVCTITAKLVLSVLQVAAVSFLAFKLQIVGGVVAGGAVIGELAEGVVGLIADLLAEYQLVDENVPEIVDWLKPLIDIVRERIKGFNPIGLTLDAAKLLFAQLFNKPFVEDLAKEICRIFSRESVLAFGAGALPAGALGSRYNETIEVINSTGQVGFKVKNGKLPDGLDLDARSGTIAGTLCAAATSGCSRPTRPGKYTFRVEARDRKDRTDRVFSILVTEADEGRSSDLVPEIFFDSGSGIAGDRVDLNIWIRNAGVLPTNPGRFIAVWSTTKRFKTGTSLLTDGTYEALAGGAIDKRTVKFRLPDHLPRNTTVYVQVLVDTTDTTAERSARGGNAERNNDATTQIGVAQRSPYKVNTPRRGDELEHDKNVRITWQNPDGNLSEVRVRLLQDGKRKAILFTGDVGISGSHQWKVPKKYEGDGFTIEVESLIDPAAWAQSGVFSIVSGEADLSGFWRVTRTVRGDDPVNPETETTNVEVRHDRRRGEADVYYEGDYIGSFDVANGTMRAVDLQGDVPQDASGTVWAGNMLAAPNVVEITENRGAYNGSRFDVSTTVVYHIEGVGPRISVTFRYQGVRVQ